jgi:hypothetical protein
VVRSNRYSSIETVEPLERVGDVTCFLRLGDMQQVYETVNFVDIQVNERVQ